MEETQKRKRGHPPWTEEQKQAKRDAAAKKRAEREAAEREAEQRYAEAMQKPKRPGRKPWTEADHAKNKATWDRKLKDYRAERDAKNLQLMMDNPTKTRKELGINRHWKPNDGSDASYYGIKLRQARISIDLPPVNINSPKAVEERIGQYFDYCEANNRPPNIVGMGNWLGVNYSTIRLWKNGTFKQTTIAPIIQRAMAVIEESLIEQVQAQPKSMIGGMFLLKSMFHYREQSDINFNVGNAERELSANEIAERYLGDGKTIESSFIDAEREDGDHV